MDRDVNTEWRLARIGDAPDVAALVNSAYRGESSRRGWTTEADLLDGQRTDAASIEEIVNAPGGALLLLSLRQKTVGCVYVRRESESETPSAYLGMLTISPDLQNGGLGDRLLSEAEEFARSQWGSRRMRMTVISRRETLLAWYERRGYRATGEREPFPYNQPRFGIPRVDDLEFLVLAKDL